MNMGMMNPMQPMMANMMQGVMERIARRYAPMPAHEERKGWQDDKHVFRKQMAEYWRDVRDNEEQPSEEMVEGFCMLMTAILPECMKSMGYEPATTPHYERESCGDYKAHHKRFKEGVDKLRRTPIQDRNKMISEMFPDLKQGSLEHKILNEMLKLPSTESRAAQLGASKEQYCEAKEHLKHMLK